MDNQKKMFQGNWSCSGCGEEITELPFQPAPGKADNLKCRECFSKSRSDNRPPRQMYQGDWSCSGCGKEITELPFKPDPRKSDQLKCRDCFRQR